jgi:hypothetical protein
MDSIQYSSIGLVNTISLWLYKSPRRSRHLLSPVCQLPFNSRSARMSFSHVQRVFIVEHYLASRSYLTCQSVFRDTFPDSPVPNKPTMSCLVNRSRDTQTLHRAASNMRKIVNSRITERGGHFQHLYNNGLFSDFNVIYFLTNRTCVRNGLHDFSITLYKIIIIIIIICRKF